VQIVPFEGHLETEFVLEAIHEGGRGSEDLDVAQIEQRDCSTQVLGGRLRFELGTSFVAMPVGGDDQLAEGRKSIRAPDLELDIPVLPQQALLYRLCGDRNPLHSDPEFAKRAGFPRPILHGMCTYGITCRGVLQTYADYDPSAFRQHAARFSSPVYPGETVTMELWKDGNVISFEAKVKARGVTVIKSGRTVLG